MQIVVAIDSFKGSLSSIAAGNAASAGVARAMPAATVRVFPLADGGEGTVDAIATAGGERCTVTFTGPLGAPVQAAYCMKNGTAVIEMSAAAGITLVREAERNPMHTTTFGVGELMLDALRRGARKFIIGIGGSATNDGGLGMLTALGVKFLDASGNPVPQGAKGLAQIHTVCADGLPQALLQAEIYVACDVKNPLCGEEGCSAVYGPQKGATPAMVAEMDAAMEHYARKTKRIFPQADENAAGAGAAGGLGFAFLAYLGATLTAGAPLVIRETGLEAAVADADLVITGEGRLDGQSAMGKAPVAVAALAKKYGKPVLALGGCIGAGATAVNAAGIDAYFPILQRPCTLAEAMDLQAAAENLTATAEQAIRLFLAARSRDRDTIN